MPQADYIITIIDGRIAERGTYAELIARNGEFAKFVAEFGGQEEEAEEKEEEIEAVEGEDVVKAKEKKKFVPGTALMQAEERNVGAVSRRIYKGYLRSVFLNSDAYIRSIYFHSAANGNILLPILFVVLLLSQGSQVMGSYW